MVIYRLVTAIHQLVTPLNTVNNPLDVYTAEKTRTKPIYL